MKEIAKIRVADILKDGANRPLEDAGGPEMEVLVASMAHNGQLMPIVVRPVAAGKWRVVCGNRRVAAARKLRWREIDAVVQEMADGEAEAVAFAENFARKPVGIYWEAEEVQRWIRRGQSEGEVAARFGRSKAWVRRRMRLDLAACRRFKSEVLDRDGIRIEEVHPTNLELLGQCGEEAWKLLTAERQDLTGWRRELAMCGMVAHEILDHGQRVDGKAWAEVEYVDEETGGKVGKCATCPKSTGEIGTLFPEFGWEYLGEGYSRCPFPACVAKKKALAVESAKEEARKVHPKLEIRTSSEMGAEKDKVAPCKASHPGAFVRVFDDGDREGTWGVVRMMRELTGKAERKAEGPEPGKARQEWEEEQKKCSEARAAVETLLDKMRDRMEKVPDENAAIRDALVGFADLLRITLAYEEPENVEFADMVRKLAGAVLDEGERAVAEEALKHWLDVFGEE